MGGDDVARYCMRGRVEWGVIPNYIIIPTAVPCIVYLGVLVQRECLKMERGEG